MSAVLNGLYKDQAWVRFIKYNEKYHPDFLDAASLVEVYSACHNLVFDEPIVGD